MVLFVPTDAFQGRLTYEGDEDCTPAPEHLAIAAIKKVIKENDMLSFKFSLEKYFRCKWTDSMRTVEVLHGIRLGDGNTVLHEAARSRSANVAAEICNLAPFLMCERNEAGETVWHISARDAYSTKVFDILYSTRQYWKVKIEEQPTRIVSVHGKTGGMASFSVREVSFRNENTALHEALLCKSTLVARTLFFEDMEVCYQVNAENKSPLTLALAIKDDAELFESMITFAWGATHGKPAIIAQKALLTKTALQKGHKEWVLSLINTGKKVLPPSSNRFRPPTRITDALLDDPFPRDINVIIHKSQQADPDDQAWSAMNAVSSIWKTLVTRLALIAASIVNDITCLIQPNYQHPVAIVMISQLRFFSIFIFVISSAFRNISTPAFPLFFAINQLVWCLVCFGFLILAFAEQSSNKIGLKSGVLAFYLKLVKFFVMIEFVAGIYVLDYKFHLYATLVTVSEWSYKYLL